MSNLFDRSEPYAEADAYFADNRKPLGYCAECGYEVYKADECFSDDDAPMMIERSYFHERCVMAYARSHWKLD